MENNVESEMETGLKRGHIKDYDCLIRGFLKALQRCMNITTSFLVAQPSALITSQ